MQHFSIVGALAAQQDFQISSEFVLRGPAPEGTYLAVLESDGETGYFYALDSSRVQPFQDGCLIWDQTTAEDKPYTAKIYWSDDNQKVLLTINDYPNAVFDFSRKVGCCRTGFPPQLGPSWSPDGHEWQEDMMDDFLGPPPPTQWDSLVEAIEPLCSIDAGIENYPEAMIIHTSPTAFLGNGDRIEVLFDVLRRHVPAGAEYSFYDHGPNLVIMASGNSTVRDYLVQQRGYVLHAM